MNQPVAALASNPAQPSTTTQAPNTATQGGAIVRGVRTVAVSLLFDRVLVA